MKTVKSFAALVMVIGASSFALVGCKTGHDSGASGDVSASKTGKCVVSGEPLGKQPYTFTHNGQEVKLCCADCRAEFDKNPEKYMAKMNSAK